MAPALAERFLVTDPKYPIFMFEGLDLIVISSPEELPVNDPAGDDVECELACLMNACQKHV
jgi:hypothetical protein